MTADCRTVRGGFDRRTCRISMLRLCGLTVLIFCPELGLGWTDTGWCDRRTLDEIAAASVAERREVFARVAHVQPKISGTCGSMEWLAKARYHE